MLCKLFQLTTGEMIVGMVEEEVTDYTQYTITISQPIKIETIRMSAQGTFFDSYIMKPLIPMSNQDYVEIMTDCIVFDVVVKPHYEKQYKLYIQAKDMAAQMQEQQDDDDSFDPFAQSTQQPDHNDNFIDLSENYDDEESEEHYEKPKRTLH